MMQLPRTQHWLALGGLAAAALLVGGWLSLRPAGREPSPLSPAPSPPAFSADGAARSPSPAPVSPFSFSIIRPSSTSTPAARPAPSPDLKAVGVELRYTNLPFGFSFIYPGDWRVFYNAAGDTVELYRDGNKLQAGFSLLIGNAPPDVSLADMLGEQEAIIKQSYPMALVTMRPRSVGGIPGLELRAGGLKVLGDFYAQPRDAHGKDGVAFRVVFQRDGKLYSLHGAYASADAADGEVLERTVQSLAFR